MLDFWNIWNRITEQTGQPSRRIQRRGRPTDRPGRYRGQLHSARLHSRSASTWQRTARNMSSSQGRHSLVSAAAKPYSSRARSSSWRNSGWSREDTLTTYRLSSSPTYTTVWPLGTSLGMASPPPSSWAHPAPPAVVVAVSAAASFFHAWRKALRLRNLPLDDPAFMLLVNMYASKCVYVAVWLGVVYIYTHSRQQRVCLVCVDC